MKNLLFIMESMQGGGAEKVFLDLLASFDRSRYRITLLMVFRTGALLDRLPHDIETIFLYPGKPHGLRRLAEHFVKGRDMLYRRDARRATEGRRWDTIVSFMEGPALKIHNCIADRGSRNITWVHINLAVTHWTAYLYHNDRDEADDYRTMDRIIFVSQGAKEAFSSKFGIEDDRLQVIHNIIPVDTIRHRALEDKIERQDGFTLCTVGRMVEQKRHDRLLEAVRIIADSGRKVRLWVLGTGPLEKKIKEHCSRLGLDDKVCFKGFRTNPYPYIAASDAFVLSSDTEGYPTVVCEALALGKPVVSTDITGSRDLLEGGAGILTEVSAEGLAQGIISIMESDALRSQLSRNATERAGSFEKQPILDSIYRAING